MKELWTYLGIDENFNYKDIDNIYKNIVQKNSYTYLAWKILRDRFYSKVYKKYKDINIIINAGFIDDKLDLESVDFYNLNLLTTPYGKILDNINEKTKNPIVLLSTGGFCPIHDGHLYMMEAAKEKLTNAGYDVVGGYFSLSHDDYVMQKPYITKTYEYRLDGCQKKVENSSYLMIDPFECMYIKTYVNFTEIINRLELYLQKFVDKNIKVAYVFGADNSNFMYCFEEDGIGICIDRNTKCNNFNFSKNNINGKNIFYLPKDDNTANQSSRIIRQSNCEISLDKINENKTYVIRNEELLPYKDLFKNVDINILKKAQNNTLLKFKNIMQEEFKDKKIEVVNVKSQIETAKRVLSNNKIISLDSYYNGDYNLESSRLFYISDKQINYKEIISRNAFTLKEQVDKISPGSYILVDDDSVSGKTINSILKILPNNIDLKSMYFLASQINSDIYDVVDFRDFIIGGNNSGLMVQLSSSENIRVPYILPYVSLSTRASVPIEDEINFSIKIWELNKYFYNQIDKNIKILNLSIDTRKLMCYIGFNDETNVLKVIDWHINILKNIQKKS